MLEIRKNTIMLSATVASSVNTGYEDVSNTLSLLDTENKNGK